MGCTSSSSEAQAVIAMLSFKNNDKSNTASSSSSSRVPSSSTKSKIPPPPGASNFKFSTAGSEIVLVCKSINTLLLTDISEGRNNQIKQHFSEIVAIATNLAVSSLPPTTLDEVLQTISCLRMKDSILASELILLTAKCRILVEEKMVTYGGPATLVRQTSFNSVINPPQNKSNKANSSNFQKLISVSEIELHTDSMATYDSCQTVDAADASKHSSEYGFYNLSGHDLNEIAVGEETKTTTPRFPRKIRYDASQLAAEGRC